MKALKKWCTVIALPSIFALLFAGCSGGGGGSSPNPGPAPEKVQLSGTAADAILTGATVSIFALDAGGSIGNLLGTATTDANGGYSIDIGTYSGNVMVEAGGGTFTDDATGVVKTNSLTFHAAMTGVAKSVKVAVTPLTEIAVQKAGTLTTANIDSANTIVSNIVGGGTNIISTMPANVLASSSSGTAEKNYGLALAAISQMVSSGTASSVSSAITSIVTDLSDNKLDTTGADISAALTTFIASGNNQTGLDSTTAPVVTSVTNATNNTIGSTILKGPYHHIDQSVGFFTSGAPNANSMSYGDAVTFTLDGYGNGTANGSGTEYDMLPDTNTINTTPNPISNVTITYATGSGGSVTLANSPYWVSVDGMVMISSEASTDPTNSFSQSEQRVELKGGTNMSSASLNGTYAVVSQAVGFNVAAEPSSFFYGNSALDTFNGTGSYTETLNGWTYTMNHTANTIYVESDTGGTFTYTVASDGALTMSGNPAGGWVSEDGNLFMLGGPFEDASSRVSIQTIGVKLGTSMNNASLKGTFKVAQQSAGFFLYTGATGTVAGSMVQAYVDTITFDGLGGCSWLSGTSTEYDMSGSTITTNTTPGSGPTACTYSVTSNGTTTITISAVNLTAWLSANGNTFIWGGGGWDNNSLAGGAIPTLNGSPVWTEQAIGMKVL